MLTATETVGGDAEAGDDAREAAIDRAELPYIGSSCAAAAAALTNVISRDVFVDALTEELKPLGENIVKKNMDIALAAFAAMSQHVDIVSESSLPSAKEYINLNGSNYHSKNQDFGPGDTCRRHQREGAHRIMANHAPRYRL